MVTGSKGVLLELKKQLEGVYPIKACIIGDRFDTEYQSAEPENMLGEMGHCTNRTPDTLMFSMSLGLENGTTVQKPNN